jgi:hypothetical protein
MDDVDLLESGRDRGVAGELDRHVDRPELAADAAGAQARDVGHDRGLGFGDVEAVEIARGVLAHRPRVVIVAVDERRLLVQRARPIELRVRRLARRGGEGDRRKERGEHERPDSHGHHPI